MGGAYLSVMWMQKYVRERTPSRGAKGETFLYKHGIGFKLRVKFTHLAMIA